MCGKGGVSALLALRPTLQVLKDMGITNIRLGGSFTDPAYYFWCGRGAPPLRSAGERWGAIVACAPRDFKATVERALLPRQEKVDRCAMGAPVAGRQVGLGAHLGLRPL